MLTIDALKLFQRRPELFFEHVLGVKYEPYQLEILRNIVENERVAVAACHSVGKSWTLARVVLWYLYCFPYSKVITTAPTARQVEKILWSEIRTAHLRAKVPLGGRVLTTELKVTEAGDWFAIGFSPNSEAQGPASDGQGTQSSFQGWHSEHLMVIFDEATGVRPAIWTMAEGLLTTSGVKFICIANPTSTQSDFYKCFSDRAWKKQKICCFDSPNLRLNGVTDLNTLQEEVALCRSLSDDAFLERMKSYKVVKGYLLTLRWVVEKAIHWGMDSPLFLSKVLGEFPEEGDNVAIPLRAVEEAQGRVPLPTTQDHRKTIGVDVARYGSDATVMHRMHGPNVICKKSMHKRDLMQVVGEIVAMCWNGTLPNMPDVIVVDETGLGSGVVDRLEELRREGVRIYAHVQIRGVQFGAACEKEEDKERFVNLKAKMFSLLADDVKKDIVLPDEEVYQAELPAVQYRYDSKGRTYIESKDEFKKRTGRGSPDNADSLALANYGRYDEITVGYFPTGQAKQHQTTLKPRSLHNVRARVRY